TPVRLHKTTRRMPTGQFPTRNEIRCDFVNLCMNWLEPSSMKVCQFVTLLTIPDRPAFRRAKCALGRKSRAASHGETAGGGAHRDCSGRIKSALGQSLERHLQETVGVFVEILSFELSKRRRWFCSTSWESRSGVMSIRDRGFASMEKTRQREIARQ